jgi:hypothetical protein
MVGKTGSGRRPGFKHSEETKSKISQAMKGQSFTEEHRDHLSEAKLFRDLDGKCARRFEELKANYPDQNEFFNENEAELIFAMRDVRTEKELRDIRRYVETAALRTDEPYQYSSSSCYAAEDAMITLLDIKSYLQKFH